MGERGGVFWRLGSCGVVLFCGLEAEGERGEGWGGARVGREGWGGKGRIGRFGGSVGRDFSSVGRAQAWKQAGFRCLRGEGGGGGE